MKITDPSRIGDIAEFYALTWFWDQGYETRVTVEGFVSEYHPHL